jgi:hypothetical protein
MFTIKHYSDYVHNGVNVFSKVRLFPLTPVAHKVKKYKQYFMVSDTGVASFVSFKDILNSVSTSPVSKSPSAKGRGKTVLHRSSGKIFGSMKAACDAHNIKIAQLKSSPDFVIS